MLLHSSQETLDDISESNLIQEVRDIFFDYDDNFPSLMKNDDFILKFLRSRCYDIPKTVDSIIMYLKAKTTHREIFTRPSQLKEAFDAGIVGFLSKRNPVTGEGIMITRPGAWDPSKITFETYTAATAVTLEVASMDPDIQVNGIIDISECLFLCNNYCPVMTTLLQ